MTHAKRGRGSRRGIHLCAIAALGIALSGCGGNGGSSATTTSAVASSAPATDSAPTGSATPAQSTSATSGAATGSTGSGSTGSGSTGSGSARSGSTSGSGGSGTGGGHGPPASDGNITLNWIPPTENTDGTALTNLAGYDIHYGRASHHYTQKIAVANAGIATYVVQDLTPGKYYFSVAAVNSDGTESPLSAEVSARAN